MVNQNDSTCAPDAYVLNIKWLRFLNHLLGNGVEQHGVRISIDGKGRYSETLFVFRFYNIERPHYALGYLTP
ncbi:hypothetical protein ACFLTO_05720 [Chloroflexota bacterium]